MKNAAIGILIVGILIVGAPILLIMSHATQWFGQATNVIHNEFSPQTMLNRYNWFKDCYSRINSFDANISAYKNTLIETRKTYGEPNTWPVDVRKDISLQTREINGILSMRNNLASEYNANMAKFQFRFTNVGDLPAGATEPLPREIIEYKLQ